MFTRWHKICINESIIFLLNFELWIIYLSLTFLVSNMVFNYCFPINKMLEKYVFCFLSLAKNHLLHTMSDSLYRMLVGRIKLNVGCQFTLKKQCCKVLDFYQWMNSTKSYHYRSFRSNN